MLSDSIINLIGVIVSAVLAYFTAVAATRRSIDERIEQLRRERAAEKVKLDLLWEIYAEDAVRESRRARLVQAHSAEQPTRTWIDLLPDGEHERLLTQIKTMSYVNGLSAYDMAVEVATNNMRLLHSVAQQNDISMSSAIGVLVVMCKRAIGEREAA